MAQLAKNLTAEQRQIAEFWADSAGTFTPPGHWALIASGEVARARISTPRATRAMALIGTGLADTAIATWETKFAYWTLRPITAIRTLSDQPFYDPNFVSVIPTPPFPSYTSGHSAFSAASAAMLEYLFPGGKVDDAFGQMISYRDAAEQAAVSRLYGGIHYRDDNEAGLVLGKQVAGLVIRRATVDGAQPIGRR